MSQFFELNTNSIRLNGLFFIDELDVKNFDNVAVVTVTLKIGATKVLPDVWPLSVPYVVGTNGVYYAAFDDNLVIAEGEVVNVDANSLSVNAKGNWNEDVRVYSRKLSGTA